MGGGGVTAGEDKEGSSNNTFFCDLKSMMRRRVGEWNGN